MTSALLVRTANDRINVMACGLFRSVRAAAVLTSSQVKCIPVPPVVLRVRSLIVAVVLLGLVQEFGYACHLHRRALCRFHSRPESRVLISYLNH